MFSEIYPWFYWVLLVFSDFTSLLCWSIQIHLYRRIINIAKSKTDQYRKCNKILISKGCTHQPVHIPCYRSTWQLQGWILVPNFSFRHAVHSKSTYKLIDKNKPLSYTWARDVLKINYLLLIPILIWVLILCSQMELRLQLR